MLKESDVADLKAYINGGALSTGGTATAIVPDGSTNWEDALYRMFRNTDGTIQANLPSKVIFFTDGVPTYDRLARHGQPRSRYHGTAGTDAEPRRHRFVGARRQHLQPAGMEPGQPDRPRVRRAGRLHRRVRRCRHHRQLQLDRRQRRLSPDGLAEGLPRRVGAGLPRRLSARQQRHLSARLPHRLPARQQRQLAARLSHRLSARQQRQLAARLSPRLSARQQRVVAIRHNRRCLRAVQVRRLVVGVGVELPDQEHDPGFHRQPSCSGHRHPWWVDDRHDAGAVRPQQHRGRPGGWRSRRSPAVRRHRGRRSRWPTTTSTTPPPTQPTASRSATGTHRRTTSGRRRRRRPTTAGNTTSASTDGWKTIVTGSATSWTSITLADYNLNNTTGRRNRRLPDRQRVLIAVRLLGDGDAGGLQHRQHHVGLDRRLEDDRHRLGHIVDLDHIWPTTTSATPRTDATDGFQTVNVYTSPFSLWENSTQAAYDPANTTVDSSDGWRTTTSGSATSWTTVTAAQYNASNTHDRRH